MRAILLAAGRGRRLGQDLPKCLLSIEGRTLLERHLEILAQVGISAVTVVVGYQKEAIREHVASLKPSLPIDFVENPRFVHGSIVSSRSPPPTSKTAGSGWTPTCSTPPG